MPATIPGWLFPVLVERNAPAHRLKAVHRRSHFGQDVVQANSYATVSCLVKFRSREFEPREFRRRKTLWHPYLHLVSADRLPQGLPLASVLTSPFEHRDGWRTTQERFLFQSAPGSIEGRPISLWTASV
ncbi:hypothetical protein [Mesorhizobium sp.]|uniref:hypothetical protein n=1 Tax=Mesorhizobium sp. TaxID=1871066 RepID=UPI000FE2D6C8|nr:hypothetical protein [Mesorhizobium sp.]RWO01688.1 MAG: hypothetical protein EOS06_05495 [Mesorhizobium sp.]